MTVPSETIRSDFDRLAALDGDGWNHNDHYHPYLLRRLPVPCGESLEIGCGTGSFARLLAARSAHVTALDLSPEMIRVARQRSAGFPNIDYQVADVLERELPSGRYDVVASIATLHHLPLVPLFEKLKAALKPGGVLLILDIYKYERLSDYLIGAAAAPLNVLLRLWKTGRLQPEPVARAAWEAHGRHDVYLKLSALRQTCEDRLPGAIVRRHLFWRYSLVWHKPR